MNLSLRGGLVGLLAVAACSSSEPNDSGPELAIHVAPLSLANVTNVCYALETKNDGGQVVWREDHICADAYGNAAGGDIAYVGTCDASDIVIDGVARNTVTIAIESLHTTDAPGGDTAWTNPCKDDTGTTLLEGCSKEVTCVANTDAAVAFDITVMRQADQGFFDVAVNFDDIFCSAKVDVVPSLLLAANGSRGPTATFAFACTAGAGVSTRLYLDTLHIACDGGVSYDVAPFGPGGNLGAQGSAIYQSALYHGREQLAPYDKCFWNTSIGLGTLGDNCHLTTRATAAEGGFDVPFTTPAGSPWPVIDVDVLIDGSPIVFGQHPLDGLNSGVTTEYTTAGESFDFAMSCGQDPIAFSCVTSCPDGSVCAEDGHSCVACSDELIETFESATGNWVPGDGATRVVGSDAHGAYIRMTEDAKKTPYPKPTLANFTDPILPGDQSIRFDFWIGHGAGNEAPHIGADGVALTIVDADATELAALLPTTFGGYGLGYHAPSAGYQAITIEVDTNDNFPAVDTTQGGHIAVTTNLDAHAEIAVVPVAESALEDGQWHTLEVQLVGDQITVLLDGVQKLQATSTFALEGGLVFISGSTGEAYNEQRIDNVRIEHGCGEPPDDDGEPTTGQCIDSLEDAFSGSSLDLGKWGPDRGTAAFGDGVACDTTADGPYAVHSAEPMCLTGDDQLAIDYYVDESGFDVGFEIGNPFTGGEERWARVHLVWAGSGDVVMTWDDSTGYHAETTGFTFGFDNHIQLVGIGNHWGDGGIGFHVFASASWMLIDIGDHELPPFDPTQIYMGPFVDGGACIDRFGFNPPT